MTLLRALSGSSPAPHRVRAYHRRQADSAALRQQLPSTAPAIMRTTTADATNAPPPAPRTTAGHRDILRVGRGAAALIGVISVAITLTGAELLARIATWLGVVGTAASPFDSLGAAFIVITPEWLKEFGVGLFGQNDKFALAIIMAISGRCSAPIGLLGRAHEWVAVSLAAALVVVVAGVAIVTRPAAGVAELVPLILGGAADSASCTWRFDPGLVTDTLGWGAVQVPRRRVFRLTGSGGALRRRRRAAGEIRAGHRRCAGEPRGGGPSTGGRRDENDCVHGRVDEFAGRSRRSAREPRHTTHGSVRGRPECPRAEPLHDGRQGLLSGGHGIRAAARADRELETECARHGAAPADH